MTGFDEGGYNTVVLAALLHDVEGTGFGLGKYELKEKYC